MSFCEKCRGHSLQTYLPVASPGPGSHAAMEPAVQASPLPSRPTPELS